MIEQPPHIAPIPHDAPPWFAAAYAVLLQEIRDNRAEIEALRRLLGPSMVSREQAARITGVSVKTISRYEKTKGLINHAPKKGDRALYRYTDITRLKKTFQ